MEVLLAAGLRVLRAGDPDAAIRIVEGGEAQVVFVDAQHGPELIRAVRARPELAGVHVVACVDLATPTSCAMRSTPGRTTSCASRSSRTC